MLGRLTTSQIILFGLISAEDFQPAVMKLKASQNDCKNNFDSNSYFISISSSDNSEAFPSIAQFKYFRFNSNFLNARVGIVVVFLVCRRAVVTIACGSSF